MFRIFIGNNSEKVLGHPGKGLAELFPTVLTKGIFFASTLQKNLKRKASATTEGSKLIVSKNRKTTPRDKLVRYRDAQREAGENGRDMCMLC